MAVCGKGGDADKDALAFSRAPVTGQPKVPSTDDKLSHF